METKKELSYFRLKLENYLSEHFPEMLSDKPFITARADEALTTYCDAVAQGFSHPEAETMASEVLYVRLPKPSGVRLILRRQPKWKNGSVARHRESIGAK